MVAHRRLDVASLWPTLGVIAFVAWILRSSAVLRAPIRGRVTAEGVEATSAHGQSKLPWSMLHGSAVAPDIILLYHASNLFHVVPRAWVADVESWRVLSGWAAEFAPKRPRSVTRVVVHILSWLAIALVVGIVVAALVR